MAHLEPDQLKTKTQKVRSNRIKWPSCDSEGQAMVTPKQHTNYYFRNYVYAAFQPYTKKE